MKKIPAKLIPYLKDIILPLSQIIISVIVAVVSIIIMNRANTITDTTNMLQINSAIQLKTEAVLSIEIEYEEFRKGAFDKTIAASISERLENAIISLLNTYELACELYSQNKINKEVFNLYYSELIKDLVVRYNDFIKINSEQEPYSAIKKVYKEWHGK